MPHLAIVYVLFHALILHQTLMSRPQSAYRDRSDSVQTSQPSRTLDAHDNRSEQPRPQTNEKNASGWTKEDREKERDRQWSSYAPLPAVKGTRGGIGARLWSCAVCPC